MSRHSHRFKQLRRCFVTWLSILGFLFPLSNAYASTDQPSLTAAVASNFFGVFKSLSVYYENTFKQTVRIQQGASGLLYAQIHHGLATDFYFSADAKRPLEYINKHPHDYCKYWVYARGQLALVGATATQGRSALQQSARLALANPKLAPYGKVAQDWLNKQDFTGTRIYANNAAGALHFAHSKSTDLAISALALAKTQSLPYWVIPLDEYPPIEQGAVWLKRKGHCSTAAKQFWRFLQSAEALNIIEQQGYLKP